MTLNRISLYVAVSVSILVGLETAGPARADSIALSGVVDNTMYGEDGNQSDGAKNSFFAGRTNNAESRRGLVRFDLRAIPSGSTITDLTLTLFQSRTEGGTRIE